MRSVEELTDECTACLRYCVELDYIPVGAQDETANEIPVEDAEGAMFNYPSDTISEASITGTAPWVFEAAVPETLVLSDSADAANTDLSLLSSYQFRHAAYSGEGPQAGQSPESFGTVSLGNTCGDKDDLTCGVWDGRPVTIRAGLPGWSKDEYPVVFKGTTDGVTWDTNKIDISLRSRGAVFTTKLQRRTYSGTGGLNGDLDVKGKKAPLTFGFVFNVEPLLIDAANLVYQVHDGGIQAVPVVRDRGVPLVFAGVVPDVYAWPPVPGSYVVDTANGVFKLASPPDGLITADVEGDNDAPFVSSTADIIQRIASNYLPGINFAAGDLDSAAFATVNMDFPYPIGYYSRNDETAAEIIGRLMIAVNGFWGFNRLGQLEIGLVCAPTLPADHDLTDNDIIHPEDGGIFKQTGTQAPSYRRQVDYKRNWTPRSNEEIAPAVTAADRAFLSQEYRTVEAIAAGVQGAYPSAIDKTVETFLVDEADAQAFSAKLLELYGVKRSRYVFRLRCGIFKYSRGQTVSLSVQRFKLDGSRAFFIESVNERQSDNSVELKVLG